MITMGKITHKRIAGSSKSSAMMGKEASSFLGLLGNLPFTYLVPRSLVGFAFCPYKIWERDYDLKFGEEIDRGRQIYRSVRK